MMYQTHLMIHLHLMIHNFLHLLVFLCGHTIHFKFLHSQRSHRLKSREIDVQRVEKRWLIPCVFAKCLFRICITQLQMVRRISSCIKGFYHAYCCSMTEHVTGNLALNFSKKMWENSKDGVNPYPIVSLEDFVVII